MWKVLVGLVETTWKFSSRKDCAMAAGFGLGLFLVSWAYMRGDPVVIDYKATWYSIVVILYFGALVPPLARMIKERHTYVLFVAMWGLISLAVFLTWFYLMFFALAPTDATGITRWERILNLPPVIAAAVGAGIGWYVHYQMNAKLHRTANSFSLAMQTRTNSEFVARVKALKATYPDLTPKEPKYFSKDSRQALEARRLALKYSASITLDEQKDFATDEMKVEGIDSVRYLLNFYEFMAFAIRAGDLDESLLYETISPAVVGIYDGSKAYREAVNGRSEDALAFQHLHDLVSGYEDSVDGKSIRVSGWRERLELEKAAKPKR